MGNCLVTKLKSVVSNDNLEKLGVIKFNVHQVETVTSDNRWLDVRGSELVFNPVGITYSSINVSNDEGYLEISPKYNITEIMFADNRNSIELKSSLEDVVKYNANLVQLRGIFSEVQDLSAFKDALCKNSLQTLFLINTLKGDIKNLAGCTALKTIKAYTNPQIKGNIIGMAPMVNLTSVNLSGSGLDGELNSLAQAMWDAPNSRRSGSLNIDLASTNCTYNGQIIQKPYTITFNQDSFVIS